MFDFINYGADQLQMLPLLILRTTGLFVVAPVFGDKAIPKLVRIGLLILLSLILLSSLSLPPLPQAESSWQLAGMALKELLVGLVIGLLFRLLFMGVLTAGTMIGYQLGLAMVTVFDASLSSQVSLIGRFWYMMAVVIFLSINGHHMIISALADSYAVVPIGGLNCSAAAGDMIIKYTAYLFVIALKIASPIMICLFLTDVALGTIAKMVPTMNVFFIGFPIKIAVGFVVLGMSLPIFAYILERTSSYLDHELKLLLLVMGEA
ncbi:MAG: flagellar biosynthetic protein FliR [candidate division Zixibacteria bacterium]|nr:flagellar biosynthetic protein FliR [candidate division Zixibacteria bacterium]MCK4606007.1 flagellar biosynthetic protein FliR [candidate division Zixibacteria bacterium]